MQHDFSHLENLSAVLASKQAMLYSIEVRKILQFVTLDHELTFTKKYLHKSIRSFQRDSYKFWLLLLMLWQ